MVSIALAAPRCLLECAAVAPATLGSVRYTVLYSAHALSLPSWPFGRRLPAHLPTCGRAKPMPAWSRGRQTQTARGLSSVAERHPSRSTPPVLGWPPLHPYAVTTESPEDHAPDHTLRAPSRRAILQYSYDCYSNVEPRDMIPRIPLSRRSQMPR
ncbi:hypothetical protein ACCO45_009019 [Purpureocillium lilacinum]|uniref:Uncharacterized protein n=1 Tax=Purpureocillium lilacinum TaxID=33203 RepID=A0ACC4DJA5_PURLI